MIWYDDIVEPVRRSRGPRRVIGVEPDRILLSDGLLIAVADVRLIHRAETH